MSAHEPLWQRELQRIEASLESLQLALFVTLILTVVGSWIWVGSAYLGDRVTPVEAILAYSVISGLVFITLTSGDEHAIRAAVAITLLLFFVVAFMLAVTGDVALGLVFMLATLFAGASLGPLGAVIVAAMACAFQFLIISRFSNPSVAYLPISLASNAMAAIMSSLISAGQYNALEIANNAVHESRTHLAQLRVSRGELRQTVRMLDLANERLQRANTELKRSRRVAEEVKRFKSELAARVSHELRTPLNLILGFSETIAFCPEAYGDPLPTSYRRDVLDIHRVGRHLLSLIEDILDLARLESGRLGLYRQQTALSPLIHEAVEIVAPLMERKRLSLTLYLVDGVPAVDIDVARIRQVLLNLLSNAARFTNQGGITVELCQRETEVVVSVADTGPGIDKEDIARAFEAYQQVSDSPRSHHEGVGLGLAISKELVELHGGRMWADSQPGKGSVFSFALPPSGAPAISHLVSTAEIRLGTSTLPTVLALSPRVPDVLGMLRRHLSSYHVIKVNAEDPIAERARAENARALICDGSIEDLSSVELPIPVIACPLGGQDINRDLPEGTVILTKPVSVKTMSDALQSAPDVVEHVLIVSEYVEFLRLLTRMLTARYGHTTAISQAMDRAAAIGRFEALKPEIVLVDLDVDQEEIGVETIAELHQRNHQKTLFVAVTWGLEDGARGDASLTLHSASGLTLDDRLRYLAAMLDVTYPASETLDV